MVEKPWCGQEARTPAMCHEEQWGDAPTVICSRWEDCLSIYFSFPVSQNKCVHKWVFLSVVSLVSLKWRRKWRRMGGSNQSTLLKRITKNDFCRLLCKNILSWDQSGEKKKKTGICTALIWALWSAVLAQSIGNRDDSPSRKCLIVQISPQHVSAVAHSVMLPHTTHPV